MIKISPSILNIKTENIARKVKKLDRVLLGSLTKKNLRRGNWRLLTKNEVGILKMS